MGVISPISTSSTPRRHIPGITMLGMCHTGGICAAQSPRPSAALLATILA
jgi:hypothetical protein